ncbi:MAG TPA: ParB/RepB/Spo0J family partition protein [Candidatus Scatomorpha pullistercoris]|uniref:ParB/RepB/Spo0J family partition protein n=1 Tax=Candidatus Scatomorpha pullistercoris TaxID=2840929 RepID=A0A9D1G3I1_9FIRM|nr:ParB/RepB/Spo0J family partition protein [Candidatus Scatomorpha pullistercoris]
MAAKKGLGTGLDVLFGESAKDEEQKELVQSLPIAKVEPREGQPRTVFDEEALGELSESIREYGLLMPVTVRKLDSGYYQLIAGERRWRAARMAGLTEIPARVIEADDRLATELALVENLQREDLNPVEEAQGYRTLMEDYGLTQDEAAQRVGKSRPAVANALRLLSLAPEVLQFVEQGLLSAGHARALVPVKPEELQIDAARQVMKNGLSVRRTEELAKRLMKPPKAVTGDGAIRVDYAAEVMRRLERALGRKVLLSENGKRGRIVLEYYGADDRERLIEALAGLNKEE